MSRAVSVTIKQISFCDTGPSTSIITRLAIMPFTLPFVDIFCCLIIFTEILQEIRMKLPDWLIIH
ncbi:hypothetical protein ES705_23993 [subsurface metagenome]